MCFSLQFAVVHLHHAVWLMRSATPTHARRGHTHSIYSHGYVDCSSLSYWAPQSLGTGTMLPCRLTVIMELNLSSIVWKKIWKCHLFTIILIIKPDAYMKGKQVIKWITHKKRCLLSWDWILARNDSLLYQQMGSLSPIEFSTGSDMFSKLYWPGHQCQRK